MPVATHIQADYIEIPDIHFHHNCALPCLDPDGDLVEALMGAFSFAKDNPGLELVVHGHADRSGDEHYNLRISQLRAETIKALLDNDSNLWNAAVATNGTDQKIEVEDFQQSLKSLAMNYGWPCDPGPADNKPGPKTEAGVKGFQTEYNSRFPGNEQLEVDGIFGLKSWQALFHVLRNMLNDALKTANLEPVPALIFGYPEGNGVYPCGESSPVSGLERSKEDRRVELVFYKKNDWAPAVAPKAGQKVAQKTDPVSGKGWKKKEAKRKAPQPVILPANACFKECAKTLCGFDDFTDNINPAKAIIAGKTDFVIAEISPARAGVNTLYTCDPAQIMESTPHRGIKDKQEIALKGLAKGTAKLNVSAGKKDVAHITVKVCSQVKKTVAVRLVHEKNYMSTDIDDKKIKEFVNKVFNQAGCTFEITRLPAKTITFSFKKKNSFDVDTWMSKDMRAVRDKCKDDTYDYNIFLVDNPSDGSTGFMDYKQRYGFVHANMSPRGESTVAHELGHGAFSLTHTPADGENIMNNYSSMTKWRLRKDQWDKINP